VKASKIAERIRAVVDGVAMTGSPVLWGWGDGGICRQRR